MLIAQILYFYPFPPTRNKSFFSTVNVQRKSKKSFKRYYDSHGDKRTFEIYCMDNRKHMRYAGKLWNF